MSLTKRFPLFDLPLLPVEQVLLLTEPRDLFFFALSSEKAWELLRKFSLVEYVDISVVFDAVIFSIRFKSGKPIKWEFKTYLPVNASEECRRSANTELKLDDMRMVLWENEFECPNVMWCSLPKEHFVDYIRRIGHLFQSICPGQRIRKLGAGNVGWEDEKVFFHMDGITSCEKFRFDMYNRDNMLEILEKTDVKRKITLWRSRGKLSNIGWMENEKIRNIPELELNSFNALSLSQFLSFENEQLHMIGCSVEGIYVNAFLKKWMNGEFTNRRTLRVTNRNTNRLDDRVWSGLKIEPMETWEKLGKPGLVRFSDELYLNPTPQTVPGKYRTVLLKNCHGRFATVVQTNGQFKKFYFTPWDHPLLPINIPKGHKLSESSEWPVAVIYTRNV